MIHLIPGDVVTYPWGDFFCRDCEREFVGDVDRQKPAR